MAKAHVPEGSNSGEAVLTTAANKQLRTIIERVERLVEDRKGVQEDIKEVLAEAKGNGFDTKIIRRVIALRGKDKVKRDEEDALIELYMSAVDDGL